MLEEKSREIEQVEVKRKLSNKQKQIVCSMKSTIKENHTFDRWVKRYGAGVPLVVAKDLWAVALND